MKKTTLIWALIAAVPVGAAALATGYIYRDTGKLPFQEAVGALSTPESSGTSAEQQTAAVDPAPQETGTEAVAQTDAAPQQDTGVTAAGPSFDVVGVEPTGETVVAGRSEAGAIVALTANGKVVGKSIANEKGEWTIILDEPLKPGDYDVGLEIHDESGEAMATSRQHLAVSLPEGGKEQPLIVLNTPDGPSDILQKPESSLQVADAPPAVADTERADTAAAETGPVVSQSADTGEETVAAAAPETETEAGPETGIETVLDTGTEVAAIQPSTDAAAGSKGNLQTKAEPEAPAPGTVDSQTAASGNGTPDDDVPAGVDQAAVQDPAPQDVAVAPEQEDGGAVVADPAGSSETDVAAVSGNTGQTEDPVQQPAPEQQDALTAGAEPDTAAAPAETVPDADAQPQGAPTVTVEAVESETDKVFVAGTGKPGSSVRVYVGDDFQGEAEVTAGGKWLVEGSKNIAEGNVEVRADLIGEDGDSVDARAAVTFEKEADRQIVLTKVVATGASGGPDGQGVEVKKSLPVVIIRKGDNLWRISRRLYGDGLRYTTIYQANQEQIRNPDLIYPGQVFLTPEGDLNWKEASENNG